MSTFDGLVRRAASLGFGRAAARARGLAVGGGLVVLAMGGTAPLSAQGVTTSSITAVVLDVSRNPIANARVTAVHEPSGTRYGGTARADGRVVIPGMRVGGPYRVTASAIGFRPEVRLEIQLTLGVASDLEFLLEPTVAQLEEITVTAPADAVFSSDRTGAATSVPREALEVLPTVSRRVQDFTRLAPQASGNSFAGQDNRMNNTTVDGSYFNNSFGLEGQPGQRTNVAPISLEAIEQVQVNVSPYDVRQGNFVGAGVNMVTKSGTNQYTGTVYHSFRNESSVGARAGDVLDFNPGTFRFSLWGARLSGPIIRNKLFFFVSYEGDNLTSPGTTFLANAGGQPVGGNRTRVLASDLDALSNYLRTNFGYETGPYQGYDHKTPATRILAKVDYNFDDRNKLSIRYNHLDSDTDVLLSNSSSLGFGTRRTNTTGLNFQNSNYKILENIRSIVGEWNSLIGGNKANNLIIGYSSHDESRASRGTFFPMVDILDAGTVYTTFGFEPFTPNNELRYNSFQLQNNFTIFGRSHDLTFGVSLERYESENVFFPGSQSVYVYNSLADWYTDANGYLANPNRTTSPVTLRRFQVRWMNIPGMDKPVQPLEVLYAGAYAQDEWRLNSRLKLTVGLRVDVPSFGETGFANANADALTFRDENGSAVQYSTAKLPDTKIHWSPRVGFNYDVTGDRRTQVRGGTGIFTGRPAYVWISNQIGNTGVLTGFQSIDNTTTRPFHPDPNHYKPTNVTGAPASAYELALTDPGFKFPQIWRTNIAVDHRLPLGLIGTAEFLYSKDVNQVYYINANLPEAQAAFSGPDNRPRWCVATAVACPNGAPAGTNAVRLPGNQHVSNAIVLKNQNVGRYWSVAGSLERTFVDGFYVKTAYSYGESKNTVDPGSIAFGSWNNNPHSGDPNNPGLAFSANSPGHRLFAVGSYRFGNVSRSGKTWGATTVSLWWEARTIGNTSYIFGGDMNGDGGTSNDLIYIPRDQSEMNFQQYTTGGRTFTVQQQADAWEAYIQQDKYLRKNRGAYAERNAVFLPLVKRADFSLVQNISPNLFGRVNDLQFGFSILNVGNLFNPHWGVGQRLVDNRPLIPGTPSVDAQGRPLYRLRAVGGELMDKTFERTAGTADVYQMLFTVRLNF
jgi:hypothetical protein